MQIVINVKTQSNTLYKTVITMNEETTITTNGKILTIKYTENEVKFKIIVAYKSFNIEYWKYWN